MSAGSISRYQAVCTLCQYYQLRQLQSTVDKQCQDERKIKATNVTLCRHIHELQTFDNGPFLAHPVLSARFANI